MKVTEADDLRQTIRDKLSNLDHGPYAPPGRVTEVSVTLDGEEAVVCVRYKDARYPQERLGVQWRIPSWMETDFEGGLDIDWLATHVRIAFHEIVWRDPRTRSADQNGIRWHRDSLM